MILVPSDLTTRSRGDIRNAKGKLPRSVSVLTLSYFPKLRILPLRQTLDDDKSDVCVGGDASFHPLDVILR